MPPSQPASFGASVFAVLGVLAGCGLLSWMVIDTSGFFTNKEHAGANPEIVNVTAANWQQEVVDSKIPVVVDFWAPWCGPCIKISPTIDKLASTYSGRVKVAKLNVDDGQEIVVKFGIKSIPAVFIFKGGKVVDVVEHPITASTLALAIDPLLGNR